MKFSAKLAIASMLLAFAASSAFAAGGNFGADKHIKAGLKCESCHGPDKKIETPEKEQCIKCHDPKKLAEKTKNVKPTNPHDSPHYHQDLECTLCHLQHEKPEIYCNQCHKFDFKMP
ncbi:cytochrome c3 family protein [Mesosutterella sp. AGMB02718]|uniref:Cytochrome c3 family protein n=1 Tax=Mesosutterella faecium TaxID=2925194 RepID=A0ABT7IPL4_9BURK|nr:cytochrome c3 family protein [Mesosutterella sp. AGMB02718]MDL2060322.1 cytochrome c3 family protein [Mesosutterella sp. AGMB02718]